LQPVVLRAIVGLDLHRGDKREPRASCKTLAGRQSNFQFAPSRCE
jgi:hypothetical protein